MNQMAIIQQQLNRGWSPQQIAMTLLQQQQQTPMGANLMNLVQQNKMAEIEQIARNYTAQSGKNFDQEFNAFKQQFGTLNNKN